ncbi:MAG TPA: ABC transporter substrate-binding protein [Rhodocyclaceae bacterium]|nr:ABC transporter substrate-binding protein [Rhodocyclaceae bacterium]
MKAILVGLCALMLSFGPAGAATSELAPDELVRRLSDEVLEILRSDEGLRNGDTTRAVERIEEVVLPHFNFRRMTMLAVGRDWREATPEQRQRLMDAFYSMLVRTYSNALTQYRDQTIAFRPLRMSPGDTTVRVQTAVHQPGAQPVSVDYVLEKTERGWMVFDVVVAGVSLVTNYRGTFAQEIRAGGIDGLIRALETRGSDLVPPPAGQS